MSERIIAYCDCTVPLVIAHDVDELKHKIAIKGKCDNCGSRPGITRDGKYWNFYTKTVSSPYIGDYLFDISNSLNEFKKDFVESKTAFIMMKIPDKNFTSDQIKTNNKILESVQKVLDQHGFTGIRADYKPYHSDLLQKCNDIYGRMWFWHCDIL